MNRNNLNIGILGGGQLGRMLIQAARKMDEGFNCIVWEPSKEGCALPLADEVIIKPYDDKEALQEFINKVDKVVLEFENIPVEIVQQIEASGKLVAPSSKVLSVVQDRVEEKRFFDNNKIPCAPWLPTASTESLILTGKEFGYPFILKTARFGYDGKGQAVCTSEDHALLMRNTIGRGNWIVEKIIEFDTEISIIGARNEKGEIVFYDIAQNEHVNGILHTSSVPDNLSGSSLFRTSLEPANLSNKMIEKVKEYAHRAMEALDIVGLLALEMFVVGDEILANEMAARPHNSGHWTIDGAKTCQFEQCIRAATGMPFGSCERTNDIVMQNLLGDEINCIRDGGHILDIAVCTHGKLKFHDYEKTEIRERRKMGHINYLLEKSQ